ncbi:MAG: glycerophosphodiester phosphodiesterase family protein [Gammaproteobacteria bacterium]|nr:hypothetical protein [Chromatiales bacterium]MDP6096185.1 glycerophosphodiester phosphodiesterase family protein [Gammaproteobacteria bacterium]HJP04838.1 glycerophosphodiester phosphodiesterase family protein [Gammaproteobacteria bacterium]
MRTPVLSNFSIPILVLLVAGCEKAPVVERFPIETQRPNLDIMTVAHRGAENFAPENTLPSIEKAIELGFDYVELDVRYTNDNVAVLMHDDDVDRTTNGTGYVSELSFDEIRKLDAGSWFAAEFTGTRVPLLEEALAIMQGKICIYWDTKGFPDEATLDLFKRYEFDRDCMLISFGGLGGVRDRDPIPKWLVKRWPAAPLIPHARKPEDIATLLGDYPDIRAVQVKRWQLKDEIVDAAHEAGLLVLSTVYTDWDRPDRYERIISTGADLLMLSNIDVFDNYLGEIKQNQAPAGEQQ